VVESTVVAWLCSIVLIGEQDHSHWPPSLRAMADIPVGAQVFDLCFHPDSSVLFAGLLSGDLKAFGYDEQGNYDAKFSLRPSKRSCRALCMNEDGSKLWAGGKSKAL
jgi:WD repeat-containing protein 55